MASQNNYFAQSQNNSRSQLSNNDRSQVSNIDRSHASNNERSQTSNNNTDEEPPQRDPAKYLFSESIMVSLTTYIRSFNTEFFQLLSDSLTFLAKFSDTLQIEFGERSIFAEAITATKSASANIRFENDAISEWGFGDMQNVPDKRLLLSMKQVITGIRSISKTDELALLFTGQACDHAVFDLKNVADVQRTFEISAREVPVSRTHADHPSHTFANNITITCDFFDKLFFHGADQSCAEFRLSTSDFRLPF